MAKALRNISKLMGQAYETGDVIPDAVIAKLTPQVLRSLVENRTIEVSGMMPSGASGLDQHVKARVDKHEDRIKELEKGMTASETAYTTLQAAYDDLATRMGVPLKKKAARSKKAVPETKEQ